MNGDLKQTFVLQCLKEYFDGLRTALPQSMRKTKIKTPEGLASSLSTTQSTAGQGASGSLSFPEHGRFVDMGVGRGHPLGGLQAVKISLSSEKKEGIAMMKTKGRRPKKWYSPTVYGRLEYLQNKLSFGFTEQAIAALKKMENGI